MDFMQSPHLFCEPYDLTTPTPMKRHGKLASFQTFSRLFQLVHSFKSWEIKLKMKKEYRFLSLERYSKMSSSQENLKLVIYFHVVVLQGRQRNLLKSVVHVQSCCFAYCVFDFLVCVTVVVSQGPYSSQKKKAALFSLLVNVDLFVVCGLCY